MADAPFITGSDILSYRGDADLGYSGQGGVAYNANPADTDPLKGTQATLDRLLQEDAAKRQMEYAERVKQREMLAQYLMQPQGPAGVGGSAFNVKGPNGENMGLNRLPQDYGPLNDKAAELTKYVFGSPDKGLDANAMQLFQEHQRLAANASQRAYFKAVQMQEAANEQDPDERAAILKNMHDQLDNSSVTDFKELDPYYRKPAFDASQIFDLSGVGKPENRGKMEKYGTDKTGEYKEIHSYLNPATISGQFQDIASNTTRSYQAKRLANNYLTSPASYNPENVERENDLIDAANRQMAARGESTAHEIPKILSVQANPDGTKTVVNIRPNATPAEIAYSVLAPKLLMENVSKEATKGKDELNEIRARVSKAYRDVAESKDKLDKAQNEDKLKNNLAELKVTEVKNVLDEAKKAMPDDQSKWPSAGPLYANNLNPVVDIPLSSTTINMGGRKGQLIAGKEDNAIPTVPKSIKFDRKDGPTGKFIFTYKSSGKSTDPDEVVKYTPMEAVMNNIRMTEGLADPKLIQARAKDVVPAHWGNYDKVVAKDGKNYFIKDGKVYDQKGNLVQ